VAERALRGAMLGSVPGLARAVAGRRRRYSGLVGLVHLTRSSNR